MKKILMLFVMGLALVGATMSPTPEERAKATIHILDIDGDGALCEMECTENISANFKSFDINKDKFLDETELTAYYKMRDEAPENLK